MKTTIYIDVDGVINAFGPNSRRKELTGWNGDWDTVKVNSFPIHYSLELIDALHSLSEMEDVTIKWLTTWTDDAPKNLCPAIGLNGKDWPVLGRDFDGREWGWWKLAAIKNDIEVTSPEQVIWIDDDLRMEKAAMWWVIENRHVQAFSPEPSLGLTSAEIEAIGTLVSE